MFRAPSEGAHVRVFSEPPESVRESILAHHIHVTVKVCNITVAVDDETYIRARIAAAERDSVLGRVKAYLTQLASRGREFGR